jgi:hypothetical protein
VSSYENITDATDLKLKFSRSLCFSSYIKSSAVYLGKSVEFSFCAGCQRASRNSLILAQILAHGRDEFQVRKSTLCSGGASEQGEKVTRRAA